MIIQNTSCPNETEILRHISYEPESQLSNLPLSVVNLIILEVTPQERMSVINRGAEFLTPKVLKYYPCLTEFLKSLLLYIVVESASGIDSLAFLEIPLPGPVLFP